MVCCVHPRLHRRLSDRGQDVLHDALDHGPGQQGAEDGPPGHLDRGRPAVPPEAEQRGPLPPPGAEGPPRHRFQCPARRRLVLCDQVSRVPAFPEMRGRGRGRRHLVGAAASVLEVQRQALRYEHPDRLRGDRQQAPARAGRGLAERDAGPEQPPDPGDPQPPEPAGPRPDGDGAPDGAGEAGRQAGQQDVRDAMQEAAAAEGRGREEGHAGGDGEDQEGGGRCHSRRRRRG